MTPKDAFPHWGVVLVATFVFLWLLTLTVQGHPIALIALSILITLSYVAFLEGFFGKKQ